LSDEEMRISLDPLRATALYEKAIEDGSKIAGKNLERLISSGEDKG